MLSPEHSTNALGHSRKKRNLMKRQLKWHFGMALTGMLLAPPLLAQRGAPQADDQRSTRTYDAELLERFDLDKNGWLNREERDAALAFHVENQAKIAAAAAAARGRGRGERGGRRGGGGAGGRRGGGRRGGGRGGGRGAAAEPNLPGSQVDPSEVESYAQLPLYDVGTLRTLFLEFEEDDWEDELEAFYHTDVELPATLRADGETYANVGVQFRGNSSFRGRSKGQKRSLSLTLDHVNEEQNIAGYRAMTLLNSNSDPTFLHSVLYLDLAREYMPALKANFVRVVINGESWGVYVNQQRFNKDFLKEAFGTDKGVRFKSSNRSRGGGLSYRGDSPDDYRGWYEIKSADKDKSWKSLIEVARVLNETPAESLKEALEPIFNVDGALRFLALDIVVMSGDGYWLHGSDYNLYVDEDDVLHILHHDTNEAFSAQGGGRGGGTPNAEADPFVNTDDPNKAMRQKLLVVPEYRRKYLEYVRDIARDSLDWEKMGPEIEAYRSLIGAQVEVDTRKLYSLEQFMSSTYGEGEDNPPANTLKGFIQQRREFLLNHPDIKALDGR